MHASCLEYSLTDKERAEFEETGYFIVEEALPVNICDDLESVSDRIDF